MKFENDEVLYIVFIDLFVCSCGLFSGMDEEGFVKSQSCIKEEGEIKLNPEAVKQIDFGSDIMGTPLMSTEKNWMLPDESLPSALPNTLPLEKRQMLSLHPYKANTPTTGIRFIRKRYK